MVQDGRHKTVPTWHGHLAHASQGRLAPAGHERDARGTHGRDGHATRTGFTLLELTVVLAVMALLAVTALPTVTGMLQSGSDSQAYNIVVSTLIAARADAIQRSQYVAVHFEKANAAYRPENANTYWVSVLVYDPVDGKFKPDASFAPRKMPGTIAVGEINTTTVNATGDFTVAMTSPFDTSPAYITFTTFTIVFNPSGNVVKQVDGKTIAFGNSTTQVIFDQETTVDPDLNQAVLWQKASTVPVKNGATALTIFDWKGLINSADGNVYLSNTAQVIGINMYTGQLAPRK